MFKNIRNLKNGKKKTRLSVDLKFCTVSYFSDKLLSVHGSFMIADVYIYRSEYVSILSDREGTFP